jgi:hypothetical protein
MVVVLALQGLIDRRPGWTTSTWCVAGLALGWILRPAPFAVARLLFVQIVDLYLCKLHGVKLDWGTELAPAAPHWFFRFYGGMLALYGLGTAYGAFVLLRRRMPSASPDRLYLAAAWLLSAIFLGLAFASARRSCDQWMLFAVLYLAETYTCATRRPVATVAQPQSNSARDARLRIVWPGVATVIAAMLICPSCATGEYLISAGLIAGGFEGPCSWLRSNTPANSIVFSPYWTFFAEMFFWDDHNRYIGAMDPIFEYAYNRRLYYEWDWLTTANPSAYTYSGPVRDQSHRIDTHTALRRDFHAAYVVAIPQLQPFLFRYLQSDHRYKLLYFDGGSGVFAVLPSTDAP